MHYLQVLPEALRPLALGLISLMTAALTKVSPAWPTTYDAPEAIEAVAVAVMQDPQEPVFETRGLDAVVMIDWARQESSFKKHAKGDHSSSHGYLSHGLWQQRTRAGLSDSALVQAQAELRMLHEGKRLYAPSPAAVLWGGHGFVVPAYKERAEVLADKRVARARGLYLAALGFD